MNTTTSPNRMVTSLFAHFLTALCTKGNTQVAERMNKDDSQISRFKNDEYKMTLSEFIQLSHILGIEFNSSESTHITVDRLAYQSLIAISDYALNKTPEADQEATIKASLYNALLLLSQERLAEMRSINNV